jgi:hypothetical protein
MIINSSVLTFQSLPFCEPGDTFEREENNRLVLHAPNESTWRQRPVLVIEIVMYGAKKIRETILIVQFNLFAYNIVILRAAQISLVQANTSIIRK